MRLMGLLLLAALVGCGGGGDSASNQDSGDTSRVALFLSDGPSEAFDHIWIEVSRISLLREDGAPVVIYETDDPEQIDLLTLQDDDLLLAVDGEVPTGAYHKVRLAVESVQGEQAGQLIDFHLASNKIDLNPRGPLEVIPGETLALRLDIDADKSIHIAGPNYNFRPVVFVDAGPMHGPRPCGRLIKGEITELLYTDSDPAAIIGFRMTPFRAMDELEISFQDDITIFGEDGLPTGPEALAVGQTVCLSGELATDGRFLADLVIIGEVQTLTGVVDSEVVDGQFTLKPGLHWDNPWFETDSVSDGNSTTVALSDGTLILLGGAEAGPDQILPGYKACIVGKMDDEANTMNAIGVFLKARQIIGKLTKVETVEGGGLLTIQTSLGFPHVDPPEEGLPHPDPTDIKTCYGGEEITVFLSDSASIQVKGGAELTLEELTALAACEPLRVQVQVDPSVELDGMVQGSALVVWPHMVKLRVDQIDPESRIITAGSGETLHVAEDAPIWLQDEKEQTAIGFADIASGDVLLVAALQVCEPTDYEAVVIVKLPGCEPPDEICRPNLEQVRLTVTEVAENTIMGGEDKSVVVTEQTVYLDLTQSQPAEMALGDIVAGDILVCQVLRTCEDEQGRALVVIRLNPDSQPPLPDLADCHPELATMEVVVEAVSDAAITTTGGQTILVPEGTPILSMGTSGAGDLAMSDLAPDDRLEILAVRTCGEEQDLTAVLILKPAGTEKAQ